MRKFIGIHGKARSGKDELTSILVNTYGFTQASFANMLKYYAMHYFNLTAENVYNKKTKKSREILQGLGNSVREYADIVPRIIKLEAEVTKVIGLSGFPSWAEQIATTDFGVKLSDLKNKPKKSVKELLESITNFWLDLHEEIDTLSGPTGKDFWVNKLLSELPHNNAVYVISDLRYYNEYQWVKDLEGKVIKIVREDLPEIEANASHPSETQLDGIDEWDSVILNEHKTNWKELLVVSASNSISKFVNEGFFDEEQLSRFKVPV